MGNDFPTRLVISINQPDLVTLFADKCPKFIHLQCLIMRALWTGLMGTALQRRLNLAAAVAGNIANIADTTATGAHPPNLFIRVATTALVIKVVVADKLPATGLAEVFLLVIAGFAVSFYILSTATGTANCNLSIHNSNILCLRCFLFARRLPAYILGHYLFALTPLQGLHYQGLRWPAEGMALPPFVARAARNALAAENASVHWHSGDGVIFTPPGVRVAWAG